MTDYSTCIRCGESSFVNTMDGFGLCRDCQWDEEMKRKVIKDEKE